MDKLTPKQKKFVDEYIISQNKTQSAIKAGYSKNSAGEIGHENLTKPKIQKAVADRQRELAKKSKGKIADPKEVLEFFTSLMRGEVKEEVVVVEGKGEGQSKARRLKKQVTSKDMLKAGELLARNYSMFTENIKAEINMAPVILSGDEDLE